MVLKETDLVDARKVFASDPFRKWPMKESASMCQSLKSFQATARAKPTLNRSKSKKLAKNSGEKQVDGETE